MLAKNHLSFLLSIAFLSYWVPPAAGQSGNITTNQGTCNLSVINTGSGSQTVEMEAGICSDWVDPSKALRIRYVWLDAISASLLFAGKSEGNLAKALGDRPYILKNKVYEEVATIINKFGSHLAERGVSYVASELRGRKGSNSTNDEFSMFQAALGNRPKIYNAQEMIGIPDVDANLSVQNTNQFPKSYSMYYGGSFAGPNSVLNTVVLWRPVTKRDLSDYSQNVKRMRNLVIHRKVKVWDGNAWTTLADPVAPKTISALRYFSRSGLPDDFIYIMGFGLGGCAPPTGVGFNWTLDPTCSCW